MILEDTMDYGTAEALLQELRSSARHLQHFLFADPRFHRADLLDLLLAQSRDAQLTSPDKAASLANLALNLAERLHDPDTALSAIVRARCLSANSYRLARLFDLAEDALSQTVECLDPMPRYDESHRALYCRTLSLVRWDQGRLDEALSLLRQAWRLFKASEEPSELTTCSLLLGLLHDEMGLPEMVIASVSQHLGDCFEPSCRPWLTSRAMLTLAAAATETRLISLIALDEGVRFQGYVSDDQEQLRLFALEGRARARLGFFDEAEQMIEAVRRQHLGAGKMIGLTLSSLDLLALRIAAGQPPGIEELQGDIESLGYDPLTTVELASAALDRFVSWVGGDEEPWTSQRVAATWYLQAHRFRGSHLSPLPFA